MRYHLGLGSNLGERKANLERCRELLERENIRIIRMSRLYETEPVGHRDQPWFLNQVLEVETFLDPENLLAKMKTLEREMGRLPGRSGEPRPIDLDILLAGETVLDVPNLSIPHPRLTERRFVLKPLLEIAPDAIHPVSGKSIRRLWDACGDSSKVILYS